MTLSKEQVVSLVNALEYTIEHRYEDELSPEGVEQYETLCELLEYLKLGV